MDPATHPVRVVLVSPRNPLNIGAAARAMANFGFSDLAVVAPYQPHWREAQSAIGAEQLLRNALCTHSLPEAIADCTLVIGTGTLTHRKPEQPVLSLPDLPLSLEAKAAHPARIALVFGPEKHGLTREDLSWCHILVQIPTSPLQPSMNLAQAVAVCLYELTARAAIPSYPANEAELPPNPMLHRESHQVSGHNFSRAERPDKVTQALAHEGCASSDPSGLPAPSAGLDLLAGVIEQSMLAAGYSPRAMQPANRHDLRLLLRRLSPSARDTRRILGLFRRILWRLEPGRRPK